MRVPMREIVAVVSQRIPRARWRLAPDLQPLSLAGTRYGDVTAALCLAGIAGVTALEALRLDFASLGALLFLPVLASAWMLGDGEALAVSALAIAARLIGYAVSGVDLGTALAEVSSLGALAIMTRIAAIGVVEGRERAARMARDRRAFELLQERERIALAVTDTAIRRLYALTIRLQAVSSQLEQQGIGAAIDDAVAEADALSRDFRGLIFRRDD